MVQSANLVRGASGCPSAQARETWAFHSKFASLSFRSRERQRALTRRSNAPTTSWRAGAQGLLGRLAAGPRCTGFVSLRRVRIVACERRPVARLADVLRHPHSGLPPGDATAALSRSARRSDFQSNIADYRDARRKLEVPECSRPKRWASGREGDLNEAARAGDAARACKWAAVS
jgi:hypothetical protein